MNKRLVVLIAAFSLAVGSGVTTAEQRPEHAEGRRHTAAAGDPVPSDVKMHQACPHCGMDRDKFAGSRMLITYADGASVGVCSIHCTVTELKASRSKTVKSVEVADLNSKKMINAEKAAWVIGGSKKGVMTRTAKWAFAKQEDAAAFIRKNGGRPGTYKEALIQAEKD